MSDSKYPPIKKTVVRESAFEANDSDSEMDDASTDEEEEEKKRREWAMEYRDGRNFA